MNFTNNYEILQNKVIVNAKKTANIYWCFGDPIQNRYENHSMQSMKSIATISIWNKNNQANL